MSANDPIRRIVGEAIEKLQRGDAREALELLTTREGEHPRAIDIKLYKAAAQRALGDFTSALREVDAALALDPYHFVALLSKGAVLERMNQPRAAATIYRDALKIAPRPEHTPAALEQPIRRAREVIAAQTGALAAHLRDATRALREQHASERLTRFDECLDVYAGTKRVYHAEPVQLTVPRLPAIPFFERSEFPWLSRLEAATDLVRAELVALIDAGMPDFAPYVAYAPGTPVNQWAELNHSRAWSSYWLWRDGKPQHDAMARCPRTTEVLADMPLAYQQGYAPTALFSALAPRTRIPPHTGSTNSRLIVHLPLLLPGPARFRVGNEMREWRMGEAWVFDDTIEHEAWNDADETRVILIFDIWNPLLSMAERELVTAMMLARDAWYAEETTGHAALNPPAPDRTPP